MHALLPTTTPQPLYSVAASRRIEALALQSTPDLMERAGLAVAKLALAVRTGPGPAWVVCGPGNNGGDGRIAARHLQAHGLAVHLAHTPPEHTPCVVVDALFGLGLNRAPDPASEATLTAMQACGAPILAVDLPSGLQADTGQPAGRQAVRATYTLSLLTLKPGLFTGEGRAHVGQLWWDDLGVVPQEPPTAWLSAPWKHPPRAASNHKGSHGQVLVVGGGRP